MGKKRRTVSRSANPAKIELWQERVRQLLPVPAQDFVLRNPPPPVRQGVRVNTLKADPAVLFAQVREAGYEIQAASCWGDFFWLAGEDRARFMESGWVRNNEAYLQNASSIVPARLLDPQPGESVLDLCAAPGGKTSHIAALMRNRGSLLAVEAVRPRFYRLRENLKRLGVTSARTFCGDGRFIKVPNPFDRALVDAPCSSDAALSLGDPESLATWSERKIAEMAHKQKGLLAKAVSLVRPGGRIVYATCSLAPEENEAVVDETLRSFGDGLALVRPEIPDILPTLPAVGEWRGREYSEPVSRTLRICPGERFGVFFVASFVRMF